MIPDVLLADRQWSRRAFALPLATFPVALAGYAVGLFEMSGGVVVLQMHAALVGGAAAAWVGVGRGGLLPAWLAVYGALLGGAADHYVLSQSTGSLGQRLLDLLGPDGLVVLGVEALVVGTLAYGLGRLGRVAYRTARGSVTR